jgi:uncharacterized protein YlzI (FlbEa/FlbD family)
MYLNEDHVERIEAGVNSAVYLTNGTYLIVRDEVGAINDMIRSEKMAILSGAMRPVAPDAVTVLSAVPNGSPRPEGRP